MNKLTLYAFTFLLLIFGGIVIKSNKKTELIPQNQFPSLMDRMSSH